MFDVFQTLASFDSRSGVLKYQSYKLANSHYMEEFRRNLK